MKPFGGGYSRDAIIRMVLNKLSLSYQLVMKNGREEKSRNFLAVEESFDFERRWLVADHCWNFLKCLVVISDSELRRLEEKGEIKRLYWDGNGTALTDFVGRAWSFYSGRAVVTNDADLIRLLPPSFVDALIYRLAYTLAEPLTQNISKRQSLEQDFRVAYANARRVDARGYTCLEEDCCCEPCCLGSR